MLTALATTNVSSGQIPRWISSRLSNVNLNTGIAATIIDDLAKVAEGKGLEANLAKTILVDPTKSPTPCTSTIACSIRCCWIWD